MPPVLRAPAQAPILDIVLLAADAISILNLFGPPQWGIFTTDGSPVVVPDSIIAVDFRREWRISDFPVERGGFVSYDKVALPYDARVRMAVGGPQANREAFLASLDDVAQSLDLFSVVTPDATYPQMNIVHYDYRRETRNGVSMILADVWLEEVRETATSQFTSTKTPEGAAQKNDGTVQPTTPTPSQIQTGSTIPGIG